MSNHKFIDDGNESNNYDPWGYQEEPIEDEFPKASEEEVKTTPSSSTPFKPQPKPIFVTQQKTGNPFAVVGKPNTVPVEPVSNVCQLALVNVRDNVQMKQSQDQLQNMYQLKSKSQKKATQKDNLAEIVKEQDLFLNQDKIPYVSIKSGSTIRDVEVSSSHYEDYLILEYLKNTKSFPTDVKNAVKLSRAMAIDNKKVIPVYTRFYFDGQKLMLDLCDDYSRIVVADRNGWTVVHKGNNKFFQPVYLKPLPVPDKNGDLLDLLDFLDFDNPYDKVLVPIWVVAALNSEIDRPILMLSGAQGSGKTTVADIIRSTIDPTTLTGQSLPSRERDLAVTLHRQQIPSFDNVTSIKGDLQDSLCRVVTGSSIERCKLYTDNESFFVKSKRAMLITGVGNPITQEDLLDRTLSIKLRRFSEAERKLKVEIMERFEAKRASILGGILNAFVGALNVQDSLKLDWFPRMADYFKFGMAVAEYIGEDRGFGQEMFVKSIKYAMQQSYKHSADDDALTFTLLSFLRHHHEAYGQDQYSFTVGNLFEELKKYAPEIGIAPNELPGAASSLSRKLKGVVQALEHMGWSMQFSDNARVARIVTFSVRNEL